MRTGTVFEFSAIQNFPHVVVKYMTAGKTSDVQLSYMGKIVGWKTTVYKWNKAVDTTYLIDPMMLARATTVAA